MDRLVQRTGKEGVLVFVNGRNISLQFQATREDKGYRSEDMAWQTNVSGLARTNNAIMSMWNTLKNRTNLVLRLPYYYGTVLINRN